MDTAYLDLNWSMAEATGSSSSGKQPRTPSKINPLNVDQLKWLVASAQEPPTRLYQDRNTLTAEELILTHIKKESARFAQMGIDRGFLISTAEYREVMAVRYEAMLDSLVNFVLILKGGVENKVAEGSDVRS